MLKPPDPKTRREIDDFHMRQHLLCHDSGYSLQPFCSGLSKAPDSFLALALSVLSFDGYMALVLWFQEGQDALTTDKLRVAAYGA
jgi:hypothetical protein